MRQAVKNIDEARAILKEHKAEVVQKYRVREIGIFGSFVRGEQNVDRNAKVTHYRHPILTHPNINCFVY